MWWLKVLGAHEVYYPMVVNDNFLIHIIANDEIASKISFVSFTENSKKVIFNLEVRISWNVL